MESGVRDATPGCGAADLKRGAFDALHGAGPPLRTVLVAFHKPWGVLSRFTPDGSPNRPLSEFGFPRDVYPIGRLDADSEGLLLLSDEPSWTARLMEPGREHPRRYWVQVEGVPLPESLDRLARGVVIQGSPTRPCRAWRLDPQPVLPPRDPPIRVRQSIPDCWIAMELVEGRNRQVRRMTAAVGHPTLRLVRVAIGEFELGSLAPGTWRVLNLAEEQRVLGGERYGGNRGSLRTARRAVRARPPRLLVRSGVKPGTPPR